MKSLIHASVFLIIFSVANVASARSWDESVKSGNTAYNKGEYASAASSYTAAIQKEPRRPSPYRNLARSLFWQDRYAESVVFYDNYLRLADPSAEDLEQIKAERKLAASRSADDVWTIPEDQRLTRAALQKEIEAGRIYTNGGGGAWALYETLLRTGYAQPDLTDIRVLLSQGLINEFESAILPAEADLMPKLDLEQWQLQSDRLTSARKVSSDPAARDVIERRSTIVETAISLLTDQLDDAARLARIAREKNPDLKFVAWYEIVALSEVEQYDAALETITVYSRSVRDTRPGQLPYIQVVRAMILQRMGRAKDSAELYLDVIK